MKTAKLQNATLAYEVVGDSSLPPVLLIMGLGLPSCAWPKPFLDELLRRGLRLILADNRDSGSSQQFAGLPQPMSVPMAIGRTLLRMNVESPYTLEDMAFDYADLLDYLGIASAHAVGVSMGGMIAQVLSCVRPSKVRSLTSVMSASGNPRTGLGKLKAIYSLLNPPERLSDPQSVADHYRKMLTCLKSPHFEYDAAAIDEAISPLIGLGIDPQATSRQLLAILASGDRSEELKKLTVPTLILHGEDDPLLPLAAGRELKELIARSSFYTFPKMGHDLPPIHFREMAQKIASHIWNVET
jgi:proline iminopeptidase